MLSYKSPAPSPWRGWRPSLPAEGPSLPAWPQLADLPQACGAVPPAPCARAVPGKHRREDHCLVLWPTLLWDSHPHWELPLLLSGKSQPQPCSPSHAPYPGTCSEAPGLGRLEGGPHQTEASGPTEVEGQLLPSTMMALVDLGHFRGSWELRIQKCTLPAVWHWAVQTDASQTHSERGQLSLFISRRS